MKLIEILNKIASGENIPQRIKYLNEEFEYCDYAKDYKDTEGDFLFESYEFTHNLNCDVDIIEINLKAENMNISFLEDKIEKLDIDKYTGVIELVDKINEIIDVINNV